MKQRFYQGHQARKRFSQNFLHDTFIIDNIVAAINPEAGQSVVEIGPGLGALTLPVAQRLNSLTVIELDRDLAARLQAHPALAGKLIVLQQDALTTDFHQLTSQLAPPLRIFGNLPYNISTPLMFHLFRYNHLIADMCFMLQKEVVDRLQAKPGGKDYGRLSVMTQYHCQISTLLDVPPESFTPAPQVDSAVVRLVPHSNRPYPPVDLALLSRITTVAFNQRRKTLRNSLSSIISADELVQLDIDPTLRAQNITVAQYCHITSYLTDKQHSEEQPDV